MNTQGVHVFKRLYLLLLLISVNAIAQPIQYVDLGAKVIQVADKAILAVQLKNDKHWHTYWKNPGDAGLSIKFIFKKDGQEIKLKDYPWPAPKRYIEKGNMWTYGYSGSYAFFFDLTDEFKNSNLTITGQWLVCKDKCIDGTRTRDISIDNKLEGEVNPLISQTDLLETFSFLPKTTDSTDVKIFLTKGQKLNQLALHYLIENVDFTKVSKKKNILTPYQAFPFDYKHEELYMDEKNKIMYGRMYIDWDGVFEDPVWDLPENGIFKKPIQTKFLIQYPKDKAFIVNKSFTEFSLTGDKSLSRMVANLPKFGEKSDSKKAGASSDQSILTFIFFAFLGGLILNLMPCVLPVISLKLFGLIVHSDESKPQIFRHNLFYTLGVLFTFGILGTVVFFLKESGEQIGWGFQLQSPYFVFFMLLLIFIMALNMLGLFEFITPGGKKLGNAQIKTGVYGDFVNGMLATILSTPCSAPFLGSALPFAFTTTTLNIYLIFMSVGLGLAFPFIITGFFPALVKLLPRPGAWMEKLKNILGVTMLLTAVWLYDVLSSLIDTSLSGIYLNTLFVLIFFAFYFKKNISKNFFLNLLMTALPFIMFYVMVDMKAFDMQAKSPTAQNSASSLNWKPWNPTAMEKAKTAKKHTFINFTATWCLTCKVNKKLILNSDDFKSLVKEKDIQLLEGDWTKRDDNITQFLKSHNVVGVPAYFIITPEGKVKSLGEIISVSKVKENL